MLNKEATPLPHVYLPIGRRIWFYVQRYLHRNLESLHIRISEPTKHKFNWDLYAISHCYSWFYHAWLITYLWPSLSLYRLFGPHGLILYFYVSKFIPKNPFLLLCVTFNPILACTHEFWPQTHVHRDVCINPNTFGFFLHMSLKFDTSLSHLQHIHFFLPSVA